MPSTQLKAETPPVVVASFAEQITSLQAALATNQRLGAEAAAQLQLETAGGEATRAAATQAELARLVAQGNMLTSAMRDVCLRERNRLQRDLDERWRIRKIAESEAAACVDKEVKALEAYNNAITATLEAKSHMGAGVQAAVEKLEAHVAKYGDFISESEA
jgi:hypothetical protein